MAKITTKTTSLTRTPSKEEEPEIEYDPRMEERSSSGLAEIKDVLSVDAEACMYCGSTATARTKEHVVPLALDGNIEVRRGSCEACQGKTQWFEGRVLRGELRNLRRASGFRSRSAHSRADARLPVTLVPHQGGISIDQSIDASDAPILTSLPTFAAPGCTVERDGLGLVHTGWVTLHHGRDVDEFLAHSGAQEAHLDGGRHHPVDLARMVAKIAYGYAFTVGVLPILGGASNLADAFLHHPETIGYYVGTRPEPYLSYEGILHRLEFAFEDGWLNLYVQLFAGAAAPTYQVVLGHCNVRQWREVRNALAEFAKRQRLRIR